MKKKNYKWLIIIFVHEFLDSNNNDIVSNLINEFSFAGVSNSHLVLLVKDVLVNSDENNIKAITYLQKLQLDRKSNTYFFEDMKEVGFIFESERSWANIFSWINSNIFSDQTILITISHGSGFGIFGDESGPKKHTPDDPCKPFNILWISELASALKFGFKERKVNILMMVSCYMQTFEAGWFLRNQVDYLVATETTFTLYGYAFKELLNTINKKENITAVQLAKLILPQFIQKWQSNSTSKIALNKISVSVNSLKKYDALKTKFDEISSILLTLSEREIGELVKLKNKKIEQVTVDPSHINRYETPQTIDYIDLVNFFEFVQKTFPKNHKLKKLTVEFCKTVKSSIIDIHVGSYFLKKDSLRQKKYGINGMSVFFPFNAISALDTYNNNCAYFGTKFINLSDCDNAVAHHAKSTPFAEFTESTKWGEFIKFYLKQMMNNDNKLASNTKHG